MLGPYFAIIMDIKVLKCCLHLTFKCSYIPMTVKTNGIQEGGQKLKKFGFIHIFVFVTFV